MATEPLGSNVYTPAEIAERDQDFAAINAAIDKALAEWTPAADAAQAGHEAAERLAEAGARWTANKGFSRKFIAAVIAGFAGALAVRLHRLGEKSSCTCPDHVRGHA